MSDLKDEVQDKIETVKDVAHDVEEEIETVAHNTVHPEDETDAEARRRQPWMPIIGAIVVAIVLFTVYGFFFK